MDREKLIQMIQEASGSLRYFAELIADKLIAEGVIAPNCEKIEKLTAENERLRVFHAVYDRQIRAEAITDFAESLKKYYFDTTQGSSPCCLVAYHIDQILKDKLKKLEGEG